MPWTDGAPRGRDQILADVLRRGERIRRRRRMATGVAGTLAVLVPVLAFVALGGTPDRGLSVAAGGRAPSAPVVMSTVADVGPAPTSPPAADPGPPPSIAPRMPGGVSNAESTTIVTTRVDIDDPVVQPSRPSTTSVPFAGSPPGTGGATAAMPTSVAPPTRPPTTGASSDAALAPCPVSGVKVTVALDKPSYSPGETVRWTSTLENASGTTCLVSGRAFFHVEDAAGTAVGSFPHTADFQLPVKAEPGRTFTSSLSWDQTSCATGPCIQVPAGTYTVVAAWTEAGPYVGRGSFSIR